MRAYEVIFMNYEKYKTSKTKETIFACSLNSALMRLNERYKNIEVLQIQEMTLI